MKEILRGLKSEDIRKNPDFYQVVPDESVIEGIKFDIGKDIYGQDKAVEQLARAVTRSWAGMSDPKRPEMVAMFLGPTGVGKTETAKSLAKYLHGDRWEEYFKRIDCTQLQEPHSVGRLKGTEPGYVGYGDRNILITPDFLQKRENVILFDEVEKSHPAIWKWLLPVFEEGQQKALVPSGKGTWQSELSTLNFRNSHIILTSNVGAEALHKARKGDRGMGFHATEQKADMEQIGITELKKSFRDMPEFLGRIDATVVFEDLGRPEYERIFYKFMDEINKDQRHGENYLAVTSELRDYILDNAETGEYGAREIRHKINHYILDKASELKFSGVLKEGQPIVGDLEDDKVIFWTAKAEEKAPEPKPVTSLIRVDESPGKGANSAKKKDGIPNDFEGWDEEYTGGEPPVPSEKDTGEEDIKKPKAKKAGNLNFYLPMLSDDFGNEIDLAITVRTRKGDDLNQIITGIPLLPARK